MSKEHEDVIKAVRALYKEMFLNHWGNALKLLR